MKKLIIVLFISIGLISCNQKTAYVDNQEIMEGFEKLQLAEDAFSQEEEVAKAKIDAMVAQSGFEDLVKEYQSKQGKVPKAEEEKLYNQIMQLQQSLQQQQQMSSQQLQQRKNAEMDSLVKTVKAFVKTYGKDNGYTFIYGANESGNILYGKEELDITEEVTKALNAEYSTDSEEDTAEDASGEEMNTDEDAKEETPETEE
jgi:outer membrane protein